MTATYANTRINSPLPFGPLATFSKESEVVTKLLSSEVTPGYYGEVGVVFSVQDGVVRGWETVIRQQHRKKG